MPAYRAFKVGKSVLQTDETDDWAADRAGAATGGVALV
jgi:hypothetical protein